MIVGNINNTPKSEGLQGIHHPREARVLSCNVWCGASFDSLVHLSNNQLRVSVVYVTKRSFVLTTMTKTLRCSQKRFYVSNPSVGDLKV
jgi:hypothetical protein